ncbi:hypothetical protein J6590_076573 [Homalodisca vitripennis]|nr:hypothetical protein J6590_076573 [Homalodisca vitripennis]
MTKDINKSSHLVNKSILNETNNTVEYIDDEYRNTTLETIELNKELTKEVVNLNEIIKTLSEDLAQANEEVVRQKNKNSQLEEMVLTREEEVIKLRRQMEEIKSVNIKTTTLEKRHSLPPFLNISHSLNVSTYAEVAKSNTVTTKKNELFSTVVLKGVNKKNMSRSRKNYNNIEQNVLLENRYGVLSEEEDETLEKQHDVAKSVNKKKKILLCADSHGKGLTWNINNCQDEYEAVGFVKPGGRTRQVLAYHNIEGEKLTQDDVLVIISGTNDVAVNEAQAAVECIKETRQN